MRLLRSSSHAACSNLYDAIPLCPFSRSVGRWFDEKFWKDSEDKSWSWGRNCPRIAILIGFQYTSWIRGSNWPKQHELSKKWPAYGSQVVSVIPSHPHRMILVAERRERDKGGHEAPVPSTKHHPERQRTARAAHDPRWGWAVDGGWVWGFSCEWYAIVCYTIYTVNPPKRETLEKKIGKDVLKW